LEAWLAGTPMAVDLDTRARRTSGIPIAAGENIYSLMDFEHMPTTRKMGCISELRKVFPLASVHNIPVMPHSFYDGPGLLAAVHATAALGTPDPMIEWRWFDLEATIFGDALAPRAAGSRCLRGQGPDPDPDVIRAYRWN
jgi:L-alanine-DL-glutamate epimerase-like enolase superfamily enzyme